MSSYLQLHKERDSRKIISGFASVMLIDLKLISYQKKLIINYGIAGTGLQLTRIIFGDRFFSRNV